ncbi:hypothetical protein XENORESO_001395 [Xenotaenia resolanae]|uniref:Uncharacterized protein n=1 Tax=Xenotaenia resolanae TaxID=208358 RepID=A0ABV0WXU7_9TELE
MPLLKLSRSCALHPHSCSYWRNPLEIPSTNLLAVLLVVLLISTHLNAQQLTSYSPTCPPSAIRLSTLLFLKGNEQRDIITKPLFTTTSLTQLIWLCPPLPGFHPSLLTLRILLYLSVPYSSSHGQVNNAYIFSSVSNQNPAGNPEDPFCHSLYWLNLLNCYTVSVIVV